MTSVNNPQTSTSAPEAVPPVLPSSQVIIRDAQGALQNFDLSKLDEESAAKLFALLPPHRQKLAKEQQAFIKNFKNIIDDIPPELLQPGAMQQLFEKIRSQGGYITEDTPKAVKDFLNGPYCAGLRENGLYKGVKTTAEVGQLMAGVTDIATGTVGAYFSALGLPFRAAGAVYDFSKEQLTSASNLSDSQALAIATAYQSAMYMATESEIAPAETKIREPGFLDKGIAGGEVGLNYIVVAAMAAWNVVSNYFTNHEWDWQKAWADAEQGWTKGAGIQSYADTLRDNVTEKTEAAARPKVEEMMLSVDSIAGKDAKPYIEALQKGGYYQGRDDKVYEIKDNKPLPAPVLGPDGKPLTLDKRKDSALEKVQGGLFSEPTATNIISSAVGVAGAAKSGQALAQGFAHAKLNAEPSALNKALGAAETKVSDLDGRINASMQGKKPHFWSKSVENLGDLHTQRAAAKLDADAIQTKITATPDPIAAAKISPNKMTRGLGHLAEAADAALPKNAGTAEKIGHGFVSLWRKAGAGSYHVADFVGSKVAGLVRAPFAATAGAISSTANHINPATSSPLSGSLSWVAQNLDSGGLSGGTGKLLASGGNKLLQGALFVNPVVGAAKANANGDTFGTTAYLAEGAGVGALIKTAGWKTVGKKLLGPISTGMTVTDLADGMRTGNEEKKRVAGVQLATQGAGALIGGALGLFGGPLAPLTVPAGALLGNTIGSWASIATGMYAGATYKKPEQDVSIETSVGLAEAYMEQQAKTRAAQAAAQGVARPMVARSVQVGAVTKPPAEDNSVTIAGMKIPTFGITQLFA